MSLCFHSGGYPGPDTSALKINQDCTEMCAIPVVSPLCKLFSHLHTDFGSLKILLMRGELVGWIESQRGLMRAVVEPNQDVSQPT